jgi:spore germination cell wall hydrolase CwlJ-like protein
MDSLVSTVESPTPRAEGVERGQLVAQRLFGKTNEAGEASSFSAPLKRIFHQRRDVRFAALVVGICSAGLLLYASASRMARNGTATVTRALPDATTARSAVINLPPPDLLRPLSPQEAAKENIERPFVDRPDTPAGRFMLNADREDRSRAVTCLAQAIYYEAAGEGVDGGRAVAQVVLNRLRHPGYPSTVCGVVYEGADRLSGCQFSFACDGSMQRVPIPWLWVRSREIAEKALAGDVFAPIGHATHYHADYVLPYWADSLDKTIQVGRHIFYRLRSVLGDSRAFSQHYAGIEPAVREPGSAVVIPPTSETAQLANALINDGVPRSPNEPEKASPLPSSPLLVDSSRGTLLADSNLAPQNSSRRKSGSDCPAVTDQKQLAPLAANDMRASSGAGC